MRRDIRIRRSMTMRKFIPVMAGLLAVGLAAGAQAQTIRIALADDPDSFDPARAYSFVGRIILTSL